MSNPSLLEGTDELLRQVQVGDGELILVLAGSGGGGPLFLLLGVIRIRAVLLFFAFLERRLGEATEPLERLLTQDGIGGRDSGGDEQPASGTADLEQAAGGAGLVEAVEEDPPGGDIQGGSPDQRRHADGGGGGGGGHGRRLRSPRSRLG